MQENKKTASVNKKRIVAIVIAVLLFVTGGLCGYLIKHFARSSTERTIDEILSLIDKVGFVYDEQTFERKDLTTEQIADAIASSLDDYARYYNPLEYKALKERNAGRNTNLGVGFYDLDLRIDVCYYNSPAFNAGVRKGDVIIGAKLRAEDEESTFSNVYEFLSFVNEVEIGQTVHVLVQREGIDTDLSFSFPVAVYETVYTSYKDNEKAIFFKEENGKRSRYELNENIANLPVDTAYIDFISFDGNGASQFQEALEIMKERGKTRLILDLRDNGGGRLTVLSDVAASLIYNGGRSNFPIVYENHKNKTEVTYSSKNKNNDFIKKVVVLADEFTASASECLIGAMNYYMEGVFSLDDLIVEKNSQGEAKTYGKGIMQTTYALSNGGAFTLTTAKITWPDETTCIHGKGITPKIRENKVDRIDTLKRAIEYLS